MNVAVVYDHKSEDKLNFLVGGEIKVNGKKVDFLTNLKVVLIMMGVAAGQDPS